MQKMGVVGAGLMGAEIALTFALAGKSVVLVDRDQKILDRALENLRLILEKGVARGFYQAEQTGPALSRIETSNEIAACADCDLVTEAVFESLDVKSSVLADLALHCKRECVIASNTSTIPISTLAAQLATDRRGIFLGTHYFSPVSRMKLVEVIPGFDSASSTVDQVLALMVEIGKTPIRVKDVAGFAVNRMVHMFIIEAVKLVEEGVATPEDLDIACKLGLGHPIGPFQLMDVTTSSLCVQAQEIMQEAYGERFRPPALLKQRVRAGYVGGKGKPGWRSPPNG